MNNNTMTSFLRLASTLVVFNALLVSCGSDNKAAPASPPSAATNVSISAAMSATATLNLTSDQAGTVAVLVLPDADSAPTMATAVKAPATGAITATGTVTAATAATIMLSGLAQGTAYKAHFVVTTSAGLDSAVQSTDTFTTNILPVITVGFTGGGLGQIAAPDATVTLTATATYSSGTEGSSLGYVPEPGAFTATTVIYAGGLKNYRRLQALQAVDGASPADLTYNWTQTSGTAVTLTGDDTNIATFTPTMSAHAGQSLNFKVSVTDRAGETVEKTVSVFVPCLTPVAAPSPAPTYNNLHVDSPDWRKQVIYFAMIDRFNDGDTAINNYGCHHNPADAARYSGGDLAGLTDQLDYIKGLGATALWITPPVANQWWNPRQNFGGYHGYWARDHKLVDEHYGTLDDYKALSQALHDKDMYLIQDVVPNHFGDFLTYNDGDPNTANDYNPSDTAENFTLLANNIPVQAPTQAPFHMNDRNNPMHFAANIYHWTPAIFDGGNRNQELNYQLADLDDVNTESAAVIAALKDSFGYWISEVGVDGFRVDTAKYIDHPFWNDFFHGTDGIEAAASASGRDDFLYFGEVFNSSPPFSDSAEKFIARHEGSDTAPGFKSLIGFPLYAEIRRVFAGGNPTDQLRFRLEEHMTEYGNPYIVPNFVDNHDVARFIRGGTEAGLKQAMATLFTVPGIPVIWQGTAQLHRESRQTMFAGGFGTTEDQFKTDSSMYTFLAKIARIRAADDYWTEGDLTVLAANAIRSGAIAWRRSLSGAHGFVLMNSSDSKTLLSIGKTGINTTGAVLDLLHGETRTDDVTLGTGGALVIELAPREILLLEATDQTETVDTTGNPTITVTTTFTTTPIARDATIEGSVTPIDTPLQLVIDGDLDAAQAITPDASGNWSVAIPSTVFSIREQTHNFTIYHAASGTLTDAASFMTGHAGFGSPVYNMADPAGDDNGPNGMYGYPMHESFDNEQDIINLAISHSDSVLRLEMTMRCISTQWGPPNGFDHVSFHIYFDIPGRDGLSVLPEQQASAPSGFAWNLGHRSYGWQNIVYSTDQASATRIGEPAASNAVIQTMDANPSDDNCPNAGTPASPRTISMLYDANSYDFSNWEGVKVYITTWDVDGIEDLLRPLTTDGAEWEYSGGGNTDPKIMDSVGPVTIAANPTN